MESCHLINRLQLDIVECLFDWSKDTVMKEVTKVVLVKIPVGNRLAQLVGASCLTACFLLDLVL